MAEALRGHGIPVGVVSERTAKRDRERLIRDFRAKRLRALCNVCVLTTGFDVPEVDLLALVRNTNSPVLYTQIAGRGMRCAGADIHESIRNGKRDCLWLDYTDTTIKLGPVDQIKGRCEPKPRQPKDGEPAPSFRVCPECGGSNESGATHCAQCGYAFPLPDRKLYAQSNGADVLSTFGYRTLDVGRVTYQSHQKSGADNFILRVNYWAGMKPVLSEWVCLEHTGFAREKAVRWWNERYAGALDLPVPTSVVEALDMVQWLRQPSKIVVKQGEKYPELVRAIFEEKTVGEAA
jgi:DNA repair protein RadD